MLGLKVITHEPNNKGGFDEKVLGFFKPTSIFTGFCRDHNYIQGVLSTHDIQGWEGITTFQSKSPFKLELVYLTFDVTVASEVPVCNKREEY